MFSISISHYPTKLTITLTGAHERCLRHDRASHHRIIGDGSLEGRSKHGSARQRDAHTMIPRLSALACRWYL